MTYVRKLPPAHVLRQLRQKGLTLREIAEEYDVTEPAVWRALDRAGLIERRSGFSDILPWSILPQHRSTAVMERFRTILKQQNENPTTDTELRLLTTWLDGLNENNVVVNYHPEAPANAASSKGGFYYVLRERSDAWIIRQPVELPAQKR